MNPYYGKKKLPEKKGEFVLILILVSGALMIAHGSRMIIQGVYYPTMMYQPNLFDLFFDWLTLCILGVVLFSFATYKFYIAKQYTIIKSDL